jgi:hypothetical protein
MGTPRLRATGLLALMATDPRAAWPLALQEAGKGLGPFGHLGIEANRLLGQWARMASGLGQFGYQANKPIDHWPLGCAPLSQGICRCSGKPLTDRSIPHRSVRRITFHILNPAFPAIRGHIGFTNSNRLTIATFQCEGIMWWIIDPIVSMIHRCIDFDRRDTLLTSLFSAMTFTVPKDCLVVSICQGVSVLTSSVFDDVKRCHFFRHLIELKIARGR